MTSTAEGPEANAMPVRVPARPLRVGAGVAVLLACLLQAFYLPGHPSVPPIQAWLALLPALVVAAIALWPGPPARRREVMACLAMALAALALLAWPGGPGWRDPVPALAALAAALAWGLGLQNPPRGGTRWAAVRVLAGFQLALVLLSVARWAAGAADAGLAGPAMLAHAVLGMALAWMSLPADGVRAVRVCAALLAGLGLQVVLGWLLAEPAMVRGAGDSPMPFNTALCMLLSALALDRLASGRRNEALVAMLPVAVLALVSGVEAIVGELPGLGRTLLGAGLVGEDSLPVTMAPNTAGAFLVATLGFAVAPVSPHRAPLRWSVTWASGFVVVMIAAIVLTGYLLELQSVRAWGLQRPMSMMTGIGIVVLGLGLGFAGAGRSPGSLHRGVWLPLAVALGAVVASVLVWFVLEREQAARDHALLERQARMVEQALADGTRERRDALSRLVQRLAQPRLEADREAIFEFDARLFLADFPSLATILWADRDGIARHVASRAPGPSPLLGQHIDLHKSRAELFRLTRGADAPARPADGEPGTLVLLRAERNGERVGFLVAAVDYAQLFPDLLAPVAPGNPLRLSLEGRPLFVRGEPPPGPPLVASLQLLDQPVLVEIWPDLDDGENESLADLLLFFGLATGGLLALSLRMAALARIRAEDAERSRRELQAEVAESERARTALGEVERELGGIFDSISDAFYTLDRDWRFVLVNPRAEQLMQRPRAQLVGSIVWDAFPEALGSEIETSFRRAAGQRITQVFEIYFPPLASWFAVRAFPHPNGIAVYFQDISERKRAELGMLKARATSERAQRLAQLGSWEYDLSTGELRWSAEVLRIFGLGENRLARGLPAMLERVHFDDRARVQEAHRGLHAGQGDIDIEYRVLRPDGESRIVRELGTLVLDDQGRPSFASGALQDITEQRRSEDALRQLTGRLEQSLVMNRLVMDNSLDVICAMDANGRFTQVSAASLQVWGYPAHELIGRAYADLVHPDDRGATHRAMAGILAGQPTLDFRNRYIAKDGRVVAMQWSASWSQRDRMMFAVARDVTEAERQNRALRDARDSLQRAQQVARMGAWEFDIDGNRLEWSDEVYSIFRVGRGEFAGNFEAFAARVHPDDLPALNAAQARTLAGKGDLDIEHRIVLPGGELGFVHERARLLLDERGRPWRLSGSVQDITERKRQESLLRESEMRMRATVESSFDCIITMDRAGRILEFNPAAERTFGFRRGEVLGKTLSGTIVPPAQRAAHEAGLQRYLATGKSRILGRRMELAAVRADGSELQVELSITAGEWGGQQIFTGFLRDITVARRAQRLEVGQRAIFAGIAARQPLQQTLLAATRLYEDLYPEALCSVLLLDEAGERVLHGAAPSLPEAYNLAIHGVAIGEGVGSCGTAAWRGERVVVEDIRVDPLWQDYRELAAEHGLRACWSTPVKSAGGRVLATFATYYRQVRAPSETELAITDSMVAMVATAIEQVADFRRLQLSEQRFRSLFDEHPDVVYSLDMDGCFTSVNGHFEELARIPAAELIGRHFDALVSPEQQDVVRAQFLAAARSEARTYEMTAVIPDGRRIELRVTNLPIVVEGRVTGVFGIAHDISLLRKHQRDLAEALDAAEANSRQLRRLSDTAIAINRSVDLGDLHDKLVEHLRETLGAHQALMSLNVPGGHAQEITSLALSPKYAQWRDYATASDGSGIYSLVCETNRPMRMTQAELEAHPRWRGFGAEASRHPPMRGWLAVPLIASDGSNLGLLQLSDKINGEFTEGDELVAVQFAQMASIAIERHRLIERLSVRDRFFDMSLEVFVIFDPATQRWVQVNPVFSQITGYSAEELMNRDFREFVHPDDRETSSERAARLREQREVPRQFENRYLCKDGSVRWMEWVSVPGPDGLVYGVGRDISERRQAELALRQTLTDLNNRNRELQDFAFIASHDLQEPLRKIRAFADRLQQRHAQQLSDEARDYLSRTGQAAERMQTLIDDLLAYSRVAARGKPFAPVDLNLLLATVLEDLEARVESSGGQVEVAPLPTLEGDPTQLRQLFQNLLANALKFRSPERAPRVKVSARPAQLDGAAAWELVVEDNGIGFEPKYGERIFGPFQRLHGRQEYEGTGIGLAIVRRIAERHRGRVQADGRPGEGATFTLLLPARQAAAAATVIPGMGPGPGLE